MSRLCIFWLVVEVVAIIAILTIAKNDHKIEFFSPTAITYPSNAQSLGGLTQ